MKIAEALRHLLRACRARNLELTEVHIRPADGAAFYVLQDLSMEGDPRDTHVDPDGFTYLGVRVRSGPQEER